MTDDATFQDDRIVGMASLIVVESALGQFVDDAARIWAEATAKRDSDPEVAPLALSRPVIDAVLTSSLRSRLLVAVDATEQVVGFIAVQPIGDSDVAEVRYLGVQPRVWGSGVATALLDALPKWLSAAGFTSAVLSVYTDNQAAVASYVQAGWVPTGDATPHRRSGRPEQQYELGSGASQ
jgi:ribosomal protein S18 acetylase RimI-like enzyme